ncbi:MAG: MurR/RpiR family transcriptional regulator [Phycisphaerales bacterium]
MTSPDSNQSVDELIANAGDRLTPTDRRIAQEVSSDPSLLVFGTVSDLASKAGTSRPSVSRFASKLGFEGYAQLQQWARNGVSEQLSRPGDRLRRQGEAMADARRSMRQSIADVLATLDDAQLGRLAEPIVRAPRVWILSGESSLAGAHALHSGLAMLRSGVRLVEAHHVGRDLSTASRGDAAVIIDFARYRRHTVAAAQALAGSGVEILAITDGPLSPLASAASVWCELRVPAVGPFDSSLPTVAAAELLVIDVARRLGPRALEQIDRLERSWSATGTYMDSGDPA